MLSSDLLYSSTLLLAMICAGIVAVYSIGWFIRQQRTQQPLSFPMGWMKGIMLAGVMLVVGSILIHFFAGHAPNSIEPMGLIAFTRAHPAFLMLAFVLATEAAWLRRIARG